MNHLTAATQYSHLLSDLVALHGDDPEMYPPAELAKLHHLLSLRDSGNDLATPILHHDGRHPEGTEVVAMLYQLAGEPDDLMQLALRLQYRIRENLGRFYNDGLEADMQEEYVRQRIEYRREIA